MCKCLGYCIDENCRICTLQCTSMVCCCQLHTLYFVRCMQYWVNRLRSAQSTHSVMWVADKLASQAHTIAATTWLSPLSQLWWWHWHYMQRTYLHLLWLLIIINMRLGTIVLYMSTRAQNYDVRQCGKRLHALWRTLRYQLSARTTQE